MGSPFKMNPKTPLMKALVGKQKNLPEHLKKAILAAPESPAKSYGSKKASPLKKDKKLDEFGNPIPEGFKSDIKGETGGTARSLGSLQKEYKTARKKRNRTPSRGADRKTQFAAAGGDSASLARLKKTDPAEYSRLKKSTQMQDADFKKLTRLEELRAKRLNKSATKSPAKMKGDKTKQANSGIGPKAKIEKGKNTTPKMKQSKAQAGKNYKTGKSPAKMKGVKALKKK